MSFFKNLFNKKKVEETKETNVSLEEQKKVTVFRLLNAMELATDHHLGAEIKKQAARRGYIYTYDFDKSFKLTVTKEYLTTFDRQIEIEVRLTDDEHEYYPCQWEKNLEEIDEKTLIPWEKEGPWCKIVENKVKQIEEAYQYKIDEENRKEQQLMDHFSTQMIGFNQREDAEDPISTHRLIRLVRQAHEMGLATKKETQIKGRIGPVDVDEYRIGCLSVYMRETRHTSTYLLLKMKDETFEKQLCRDFVEESESHVPIEEGFWKNALIYSLEEIERKMADKEKEKKEEAAEHFKRKYRLKTF